MQLPQSSRKRGREFRGAEDSHEQRRRYGLVAPVVSPYGGRDDAFALLSAVHKIESALSRIDIVLPIQSAVGLTEPLASVVRVSLDIRDLIYFALLISWFLLATAVVLDVRKSE